MELVAELYNVISIIKKTSTNSRQRPPLVADQRGNDFRNQYIKNNTWITGIKVKSNLCYKFCYINI